jgi:hypothetical protein
MWGAGTYRRAFLRRLGDGGDGEDERLNGIKSFEEGR